MGRDKMPNIAVKWTASTLRVPAAGYFLREISMPLSALAEAILQPVFEVVLHVFGYLTGVVAVPTFTLGVFRVEPILGNEKLRLRPKLKKMRVEMPRPRVISANAGTAFGLLFWALVAVAVYLLKYHT